MYDSTENATEHLQKGLSMALNIKTQPVSCQPMNSLHTYITAGATTTVYSSSQTELSGNRS